MEKIEIKGAIIPDGDQWVYDWFGVPATSPNKVNKALEKANGEDVEVIINSGGGSVFAGSEIFTTLRSYNGNVKGQIVGLAASAASVVAMGIKNLVISPTAQIMIHKASTITEGNSEDIQKTVELLNGIDKSIANAYILKTGLEQSEILDMMSKETWLTSQKAKDLGFVDGIMFIEENSFSNNVSINNDGTLPKVVIDKMRNEFIKNDKINNSSIEKFTGDEIERTIDITEQKSIKLAKTKLKLTLANM